MERPDKLEPGQRWKDSYSQYEIVSASSDTDYRYRRIGRGDGREFGGIDMVSPIAEDQFIGWAPGYGPTQERPVDGTNSTGYQAASWLREVAKVLEQKSISYGDSVGKPLRVFSKTGVTEGIRVRIDDKLSRVARGSEWPGDDVIVDLVGYLALLAVTEKK